MITSQAYLCAISGGKLLETSQLQIPKRINQVTCSGRLQYVNDSRHGSSGSNEAFRWRILYALQSMVCLNPLNRSG
jgi:hypothetical protein